MTSFGSEGFTASKNTDQKHPVKLGGKSVQVSTSGMGLQVYDKKLVGYSETPTTYIYQTLQGWAATDTGFEVDSARENLVFTCSQEIAEDIIEAMGEHAGALAKALVKQRDDENGAAAPAKETPKIKMDSMESAETSQTSALLADKKYDVKLGGKSVQVCASGMGLQVFPKRGAPTTYIYQTMLGWSETEDGFEVEAADGKGLEFTCASSAEGAEIVSKMTSNARALAVAQRTADETAGLSGEAATAEAARKAKALALASSRSSTAAPAPEQQPPEALGAAAVIDQKYDAKLGGKSVQVAASGMGLQVFSKKGAPTTYIYQTLLAWVATDDGFSLDTASGKTLDFVCADGSAVVKTITKQARALAVAQRDSEREAGVTDHSETLDARKAKAKALAMKGHDGGAETAAADGIGKTNVAKTPKKQEAEEVRPQPPKDEVKRQGKETKKGRKSKGKSKKKVKQEVETEKEVEPEQPVRVDTKATEPAEAYSAEVAASPGSWLSSARARGGSADALVAPGHWGREADAGRRTVSPLLDELVFALPPMGMGRDGSRQHVADLCVGSGRAAAAVRQAYPDVDITLIGADEDSLFRAERQVAQSGAQMAPQQGGQLLTAQVRMAGSYDVPLAAGGYDVIVAAQSLQDLVSPGRSSLEAPDSGEVLDSYRWYAASCEVNSGPSHPHRCLLRRLFARVAASLRIGGTFLIADRTDALGLYGHMRLLEESGFEEIDCAWRQNHSFVCGGTKVG